MTLARQTGKSILNEILKVLEILKDPALIAMMVIIYLLIRQNGKLMDSVERNTKTLTELSTLLNLFLQRMLK